MRFSSVVTSALAAVALTACGGLTDVADPSDVVSLETSRTEAGAIDLYRGAITRFSAIFAGGAGGAGWSYVYYNGLFSDEYVTQSSGGAPAAYMLRTAGPRTSPTMYNDLHTARLNIDQAIGALTAYAVATPTSYVAELHGLKGFLYLFFSELYCSGVPFSYAQFEGEIVVSGPVSTEEMLDRALAQFDTAIALAGDSVRITQMATVGKARTLLDQGKFSEAGALVTPANVPLTFAYNATYGAGAQHYWNYAINNPLFLESYMADYAGGNGLDYMSSGTAHVVGGVTVPADPRVTWVGKGLFSPQYPAPSKFLVSTTPIPVANGLEARLIEAEAALRADQIGVWAGILNTLRQTAITPAIPALSADSTTTASPTLRENVMFRERAFWLYGTGHRTGDMRRLIRQYGRPWDTVFPIGTAPQLPAPDNVYGTNVNLEPPKAETDNNANYHGCFNRDA